jgi:integrase
VDLHSRLLHIPQTKNGSARTIPLTERAVELLKHRQTTGGDAPFSLTPNAVRLAWDRLTERAGIEDLHFHDLRHEAISRFFERGLSVPEVALISGHKDYRMLSRYTHLRAADLIIKL